MKLSGLLLFAFLAVLVPALLAIGADFVAPYDPVSQDIIARLRGPMATHWLGTDQLGRDVLSRILYGSRASLLVAVGSVGSALLLGGGLGLLAAYYRGWFERIVMRLMDILFAFPVMLLAIGVVAVLGPGAVTAAIAIAVVYTPIFARLLRGPALVICDADYVAGARAARYCRCLFSESGRRRQN